MKTTGIIRNIFILLVGALIELSFAGTSCPQNIIIIIVDGGGFNHFKALDCYQSSRKGLPFEKFPVRLAVSTYPASGSYDAAKAISDPNYVQSGNITDSAAAATAISTGFKTSPGSLGIDANGKNLEHIIERCEKLGLSTGVVTTVPISHATPAGFVVHKHYRYGYEQIADEMINKSALEVIFGCGNPFFDDNGKKLKKPASFQYVSSEKIWNSLIEGTAGSDADGDGIADKWTFIQNRQDFITLADGNTPKRVLGVAQVASTLQQKRTGKSDVPFDVPFNQNVPTLAEMTKAALNVLDNNPDGFFVMIEAGAVDWASHGNDSARTIEELLDFAGAFEAVKEWIETKSSWKKTLLIITADHETGYLKVEASKNKMPAMKWHTKKHTNSLVPFYARGCGAELFRQRAKNKDPLYGPYIDNTDIAKVIFSLLNEKKISAK